MWGTDWIIKSLFTEASWKMWFCAIYLWFSMPMFGYSMYKNDRDSVFKLKLLFRLWWKVTLSIIAFIFQYVPRSGFRWLLWYFFVLVFFGVWNLCSTENWQKLHEWMNNDRISILSKDCFKMIFCTWFYLTSFVSCSEMLQIYYRLILKFKHLSSNW